MISDIADLPWRLMENVPDHGWIAIYHVEFDEQVQIRPSHPTNLYDGGWLPLDEFNRLVNGDVDA